MKAVVLAGGKGTRLAPYTTILPKPLMPVGDMPILEILLRQMKNAGISEAILTVGHLAKLLQLFFQEGEHLGLNIRYSHETFPMGTAGPLTLIEDLDDTFLVTNGDVLTTLSLPELIKDHQRSNALATIAMHERDIKIDLGVIELGQGTNIVDYVEKPTMHYRVSMGIYVFEPEVLTYIPRDSYFDFPELVKTLLAAGEKVNGFPFSGYWQDLGRPDDYQAALADFERMRDEFLPASAQAISDLEELEIQ